MFTDPAADHTPCVGERFAVDRLTYRVTGVRPGYRRTALFARVERAEPNSGCPVLVGPEQVFPLPLTGVRWLEPGTAER